MLKRQLEYHIDENNSGLTAREFLINKGFSTKLLTSIKKNPASIELNGSHCLMKQVIACNDTLIIKLFEENSSQKIPPIKLPLDIVYEDEDILVINKSAGMPIHPSLNNYENTLGNAVAYYYASKKEPFIYRCLNRLDKDTSGLTIIAKNSLSAGILSKSLCDKTDPDGIKREYLAIVKGQINPPFGTINAPIARVGDSIIERTVDFEYGESAITHYRVLKTENGYSLVHLILDTGRTHQIRVHMKYIGHPLIGDYLYNPDFEKINRQALHSYRLTFKHPITNQTLTFLAPLPKDMADIISEI